MQRASPSSVSQSAHSQDKALGKRTKADQSEMLMWFFFYTTRNPGKDSVKKYIKKRWDKLAFFGDNSACSWKDGLKMR